MESFVRDVKELKNKKDASEIGIVTNLDPFSFSINGVEYSSEDFTMYLPAVDRIRHFEKIDVETYVKTDDPNPHLSRMTNIGKGKGETYIDVGDLELEPDLFERRFLIGDLIDVTDRGDSFIVHGRLVKIGDTEEVYKPTHRDIEDNVKEDIKERRNRPPLEW